MCLRMVLLLICLGAANGASALQDPAERRFVIPPNDIYLLTVASQADCPIQVEDAKLLFFNGPGSSWSASYRLRAAGVKPIRINSITLSMWTALGVGATWQELVKDSEKSVIPGELIPIKQEGPNVEVLPLTNEIRDRMKLRGPMQAVVVLMVEQVKFSDGSVYSAETTSKALQSYFQKIDIVRDHAK